MVMICQLLLKFLIIGHGLQLPQLSTFSCSHLFSQCLFFVLLPTSDGSIILSKNAHGVLHEFRIGYNDLVLFTWALDEFGQGLEALFDYFVCVLVDYVARTEIGHLLNQIVAILRFPLEGEVLLDIQIMSFT